MSIWRIWGCTSEIPHLERNDNVCNAFEHVQELSKGPWCIGCGMPMHDSHSCSIEATLSLVQ